MFLLVSCSGNNPVLNVNEQATVWVSDSSIKYSQKYVTSLIDADTSLYMVTPYFLIKFTDGSGSEAWNHHFPSDWIFSDHYKYCIAPDLFVTSYDYTFLEFQNRRHSWLVQGSASVYIKTTDIDSSLTSVGIGGVVTNNKGTFLTSATYGDSSGLLLFKFKMPVDSIFNGVLYNMPLTLIARHLNKPIDSIIEFKTIKLTNDPIDTIPSIIEAVNENFIVVMGHKTYTISPNGLAVQTYDHSMGDIVCAGNYLLSVGLLNDRSTRFLYSKDDGKSWTSFDHIEGIEFTLDVNMFSNVNGTAVLFRNDQIWSITPTGAGVTIKELDNRGLEGNQITGLAFHKGCVWVATLSGIFRKKWDEFLK
jgi:hypothetical protein